MTQRRYKNIAIKITIGLLAVLLIMGMTLTEQDPPPKSIHIAVATNFTAPMKQIAAEFEKDTGQRLILSFASSGKLFAQIKNGASFELFLSADTAKPVALIKAGLAVEASQFTYAQGSLVLWSPNTDLITSNLPAILQSSQFSYLAIANPRHAPYGQAAVETLRQLKLYDKVSSKLVQGENIAQTYQFVQTGNAQLGFIALSQIMSEGKIKSGSFWLVPEEMHAPIQQNAVLLKSAEHNPQALALLTYLKSAKVKAIIQSYGYKI